MLEQLAGPFDVVDGQGNPVTLSSGLATQWDDDVGLISHATIGGLACYCVSQLDGVTWPRSTYQHEVGLSRDLPGSALMQIFWLDESQLFSFDKFSGTATGILVTSATTGYVSNIHIRLPDRFLRVVNGHVYWMPLTAAQTETVEYVFDASWSGGMKAFVSLTDMQNTVCLIWQNGVVTYYDWVKKTEVLPRAYLPANVAAWFSPRLGLFVLLDADLKINVFATTPAPETLTDPVALAPLKRGHKSRLQVTLTGDHGEACGNETVEWSINGVGELSALQSKTGIDGVATVDYYGTLDTDAATEIQAVVRY